MGFCGLDQVQIVAAGSTTTTKGHWFGQTLPSQSVRECEGAEETEAAVCWAQQPKHRSASEHTAGLLHGQRTMLVIDVWRC